MVNADSYNVKSRFIYPLDKQGVMQALDQSDALANPHRLRVFLAVAEQMSFGRAGEHLHISQPAVSTQIKQLEQALGKRLFQRQRPNLRLTEAGEALRGYAKRYFAFLDEMESGVRGRDNELRGHVRLGASFVWEPVLPAILGSFRIQNPNVTLSVRFGHSTEMISQLVADEIEVGFLTQRPNDERIEVVPVGESGGENAIIVSAEHPLAADPPEDHRVLDKYPHVNFPAPFLSSYFRQLGVRPRYAIEATSFEAIQAIVSTGAAISLVLVSMIRRGGPPVVRLPTPVPPNRLTMFRARRRDAYLSSASRALLETVAAALPAPQVALL